MSHLETDLKSPMKVEETRIFGTIVQLRKHTLEYLIIVCSEEIVDFGASLFGQIDYRQKEKC